MLDIFNTTRIRFTIQLKQSENEDSNANFALVHSTTDIYGQSIAVMNNVNQIELRLLADCYELNQLAVTHQYVKNGHYNEALSWALRSELSDLINLVSNKMLSTFNAEAISQLRIFDATSTMFLNYPNLLLLQRFYQFRRFLVQGQASGAAGKLYELVTSGMAPIAFQVVPELDRDSIYDLMKAVNNFELQNAIIHPSKAADSPHTVELQTKIKFLRQALCSALALRSLS
ncbi:Nuclear pore complex protein Nup85 [Aphelenchoides besseyi]|nr:Nuclear pore complex protein Nup85 [Aphelenchoides besseyi]